MEAYYQVKYKIAVTFFYFAAIFKLHFFPDYLIHYIFIIYTKMHKIYYINYLFYMHFVVVRR